MKTKTEILNETVEYYSKNPRANEGGRCQYLTCDGRMCAVGRCLIDPGKAQAWSDAKVLTSVFHLWLNGKQLDADLREEYRDHDLEFWHDLQTLHDRNCNWGPNGLTEAGASCVNEMLEIYSEDN